MRRLRYPVRLLLCVSITIIGFSLLGMELEILTFLAYFSVISVMFLKLPFAIKNKGIDNFAKGLALAIVAKLLHQYILYTYAPLNFGNSMLIGATVAALSNKDDLKTNKGKLKIAAMYMGRVVVVPVIIVSVVAFPIIFRAYSLETMGSIEKINVYVANETPIYFDDSGELKFRVDDKIWALTDSAYIDFLIETLGKYPAISLNPHQFRDAVYERRGEPYVFSLINSNNEREVEVYYLKGALVGYVDYEYFRVMPTKSKAEEIEKLIENLKQPIN